MNGKGLQGRNWLANRCLLVCLWAMVLTLPLIIACTSPGSPSSPGEEFAPVWQVEKSEVEEQGIVLNMLDFNTMIGGATIIFYALYDLNADTYMAPAEVIISDDTGKLVTEGDVTHLGHYYGVNFGTITFPGPLFESSLLNFEMKGLTTIRPGGPEKVVFQDGELEGFMTKTQTGTEPRRTTYYAIIHKDPYAAVKIDEVTVKRVDIIPVSDEPALRPAVTRTYNRWMITAPTGESSELFYTVSRTGEVRPVTLREYEDAEASQRR